MFGSVLFINESVTFGSMSIAEKFDFIAKKIRNIRGKEKWLFQSWFCL